MERQSSNLREDWWCTSSDPSGEEERDLIDIQVCMTRLLRQKLLREELKTKVEQFAFESRLQEQRAVCSSVIALCRKAVQVLYHKMVDFTEVKQKKRVFALSNVAATTTPINEVWWKDCLQEQRAYTYFAQKLAESYENFQNKAKFMRPFVEKIFKTVPTFAHLQSDALIKGFFFVFVHKDFVVREIVTRIVEQLPHLKDRRILDQLEKDYRVFMECDLCTWCNVLLYCEIFQSY